MLSYSYTHNSDKLLLSDYVFLHSSNPILIHRKLACYLSKTCIYDFVNSPFVSLFIFLNLIVKVDLFARQIYNLQKSSQYFCLLSVIRQSIQGWRLSAVVVSADVQLDVNITLSSPVTFLVPHLDVGKLRGTRACAVDICIPAPSDKEYYSK